MLLWFRRVKLLACIKQRKQLRRLMKRLRLRTGQRIIKTWKDSGEPSPSRKKCGQKKINGRDRRSFKVFGEIKSEKLNSRTHSYVVW